MQQTEKGVRPDPIGEPEWPALIVRVIDDGRRILRAEAALLEIGLREAIGQQTDRLLAGLIFSALAVCSLICILIAAVLLLHEWMKWWLAFGLAGAIALSAAVFFYQATSLARADSHSPAEGLERSSHEPP